MPELPEVETVRQGLLKRALRRPLVAVEVHNPGVIVGSADDFIETVVGRRIHSVVRKGKVLALELIVGNGAAPRYLLVRLGMTGQLTVTPQEGPLVHTRTCGCSLKAAPRRFATATRGVSVGCAAARASSLTECLRASGRTHRRSH